MPCHNPECMKKYDFDHIVFYARKRYVEGFSTMELMSRVSTDRERSHVAMASLLDLDDDSIREFCPSCSDDCLRQLFVQRNRLSVIIARLKSAAKANGRNHTATLQPAPAVYCTGYLSQN